MTISSETIDYGPCAFMDTYNPAQVYSSIDQGGRYAYAAQPSIALWNLTRFAEALLPVINPDQDAAITAAQETLNGYAGAFQAAFAEVFGAKVGLDAPTPEDIAAVQDLLKRMAEGEADFTLTFRALSEAVAEPVRLDALTARFKDPALVQAWLDGPWQRWLATGSDPQVRRLMMRSANPAFIPRNHQVEAALGAAVDLGDYTKLERLVRVLATPFSDQPDAADLATPPRDDEIVRATFCGT
jgi:uncharacterized protein YdiU (UPF0061 family)